MYGLHVYDTSAARFSTVVLRASTLLLETGIIVQMQAYP